MAKTQKKPPRYHKGAFRVCLPHGYCALPVGGDTYHGTCPHDCLYCTPFDAPVLMANGIWKEIGNIQAGDQVIGFNWVPGSCKRRRREFAVATVDEVFVRKSAIVTIQLESGRQVKCTPDHHWFTGRKEPKYEYLPAGINKHPLFFTLEPVGTLNPTNDYRLGYVQGVIDGDGCVTDTEYRHSKNGYMSKTRHIRVAVKDVPILDRYADYCKSFGYNPSRGEMNCGNNYMLPYALLCGPGPLAELVYTKHSDLDDYWRGWLAGIMDTEGSFTGTLRLCQYKEVHPRIYAKIVTGLSRFGFDFREEDYALRVLGGRKEVLRFWQLTQPVLWRKFAKSIIGTQIWKDQDTIVSIEPSGFGTVVSMKTSTGNYISQGYWSRNCFEKQANNQHLRRQKLLPRDVRGLFNSLYDDPVVNHFVFDHGCAVQIGVVADPFPYLETKEKNTLRLLKMLAKAGVQAQLTTKGPNNITDEHIAALKALPKSMIRVSFSTLDDATSARLEPGVRPPSERLAHMKRIHDAGVDVACRLSPCLLTETYDYQRIADTGAINVAVEPLRFSMLWRHSFPPEFWEIVSGQEFPGGDVAKRESVARQWVEKREKEYFAPLQDLERHDYYAPINLWVQADIYKLREWLTEEKRKIHANGMRFAVCCVGCAIHNIDLIDAPCGCLTDGWGYDRGALVPSWHEDQWERYKIPGLDGYRYDVGLDRVIIANSEFYRPIAADNRDLGRAAILEETDMGQIGSMRGETP